MKNAFAIAILGAATALPLFAQQQPPAFKTPRVSPKQVLTQTVGLTDVTITYSRPGVKNRLVWGGLVPYDKVWRTGANEATTIAFTDDVMINGQPLAKGTYSLHTIPGQNEWTLIFNKIANQWGSFSYDAAQDALRVKVKPQAASMTEWMMFDVPDMAMDRATFELRWEKLAVPFTVSTNTSQKVLAEARAAVAAAKPDDWRTPMRAAQFADDAGLAKEDAWKWLDASIKANENINNLYLKARMQARAGDRAAAIRTAEMAIAKGTDKDKEEIEEIRKNIAVWKMTR